MYKYQVNFSKRFQNGILAGKLYHDHLEFSSKTVAAAYITRAESGEIFNACNESGDYKIEDCSLFQIE